MKPKPITCLFVVIFLGLVCMLSACDDIIEPSISKKSIIPEAPVDQYQSTSYTIGFWWDQVDHALSYHLQVVTPTFQSPGSLILDTIITKNTFSFNFSPGSYQWRVMAENGSSQTTFSVPRNFIVNASSIKQQSVQLISPANNFITNQSLAMFKWGNLYGATVYRFEIDTNNFADESKVLSNVAIPGQQMNFNLPKDHIYQWRVRAENDTAQARWSLVNIITYDHTPPGPVSLTSPTNTQTVSLPVTLQWAAVASVTKYKVYVLKSDSTSIYNNSFPVTVSSTNYGFKLGSSGDKIYWKVSAVDIAGNEGQPSETRSFILQ